MSRILSFLFIYSLLIFQGKYVFSETPLIQEQAGTFPVILSAPHGGRDKNLIKGIPAREGKGVKLFRVKPDKNTDILARKTADILKKRYGLSPYMVIAGFPRKQVDVNRERANAYEDERMKPYYDGYHGKLSGYVSRCAEKFGSCLLVDIHGQGKKNSVIYRGTRKGKSVTGLVKRSGTSSVWGPKSVAGVFEKKGYTVLPGSGFDEKNYQGGYILDQYGTHRPGGADSIQLEFGGDFRKAGSALDKTASDLADAIYIFYNEYLKSKAGKVR